MSAATLRWRWRRSRRHGPQNADPGTGESRQQGHRASALSWSLNPTSARTSPPSGLSSLQSRAPGPERVPRDRSGPSPCGPPAARIWSFLSRLPVPQQNRQ